MKTIFEEQAEVGNAINRVKDYQDKALDMYDNTNETLKALLRDLVKLENDLEKLDKEYETLIKEAF